MLKQFDAAVSIVLKHEGGFQKDPQDKGNWTGGEVGVGELKGTNYGISAAQYPTLDIANLNEDHAKAIYLSDYYLKFHISQLPPAIVPKVLDMAVLMGAKSAIKQMQIAINQVGIAVKVDGTIGEQTVTACHTYNDDAALLETFKTVCADHYKSIAANNPDEQKYLAGWLSRVNS